MFDFEFFQNEEIVRKYNNIKYKDDMFITEDISYDHNKKLLTRNTKEYQFVIDFKDNIFYLKVNDQYEGKLTLLKSIINEKKDVIELTYQLEKNEPIFKIIITRRKYER